MVWRDTIRHDGEDTAAYGSRSPHMPAEQEEEMGPEVGPEVGVWDRKIYILCRDPLSPPGQTSWGFYNLSEQN